MLKRDRQGSVRERIVGSQSGQRQSYSDGLLEPSCIAQSAHQPMVGLEVCGVRVNCRTKLLRRLCGRSGSQLIKRLLCQGFGNGGVRASHIHY